MRASIHGTNAVWVALALCAATGCGAKAHLNVLDGTGPNPTLPPPNKSLVPLVNVVTA